MYKDVLQNIENVAVWPIMSLVVFVVFFLVITWWAFKVDKSFTTKMSRKPLEDDDQAELARHKSIRL